MRVLIDCRSVSERVDGLGRYTLGLVRGILERPDGADISLAVPATMSPSHPLRQLVDDHRPAVLLVDAGLMSLSAQIRVPALVKRFRPDVFHYPHFNLPFATPGRVVVTIHDLGPLTEPDYFKRAGRVKRAYFRAAAAFSARRAAAVITPTAVVAEDVRRLLWARAAVSPVAEGVADTFRERPSEAEIRDFRERHGLRLPYFLYIGVQRPRKNLPRLIEAFGRAAPRIPHDLVLAGQEVGTADAVADAVGRSDVQDRVRRLGYLSESELPAAYAGADAFVLCSTVEGFGLGVIEAMQSGTPVVTTAWGATAEVARDAALLVDAYSVDDIAGALIRIATDEDLRADLRTRGSRRAAEFTWARAAERTLEVYERACTRQTTFC